MLSAAAIEHYRRMTPRERIAEMKELLDVAERALRRLPPEEAERRLKAADEIRARSRAAMLDALRRLEERHRTPDRE